MIDLAVALILVSAFALCELGIILILLSRPKPFKWQIQEPMGPRVRWPGAKP